MTRSAHDPADSFFHRKLEEGFDNRYVGARKGKNLPYPPPAEPYCEFGPWLTSGVHCMILSLPLMPTARDIQNLPLYGEWGAALLGSSRSGSMAGGPASRRSQTRPNPPRQHGIKVRTFPGHFRVFLALPDTKFLAGFSTNPLHFLAFSAHRDRCRLYDGSLCFSEAIART